MVYEEIERRRHLLRTLYAMIQDVTGPDVQVDSAYLHRLGPEIGLTSAQIEKLFIRLIKERYIRVYRVQNGTYDFMDEDEGQFYFAVVRDLTDKGLKLINVLPAEDSIEGVIQALEGYLRQVEEGSASPEEKEKKRNVIRALIGSVRTFAVEVTPKLAAEMFMKGLGL